MGHDGDACRGDRGDLRRDTLAALELDRVGQPFLHEPGRGREGLLRGALVAAEREVRHHESVRRTADDAANEGEEFVDRDRDGGLVSVDDVGSRVADEENGNPGFLEDAGAGVVVGGEHRPAFTLGLHGLQVVGSGLALGNVVRWC